MSRIEKLMRLIEEAEADLMAHIRSRYPIGTELAVKIQRNHRVPSLVKVIGHIGGAKGQMRVKILRARHGPGFMTTVSVRQIVEERP